MRISDWSSDVCSSDLTLADSSTQGVFRWVLMELLGRSAVPLLGMISGWLVAGSASHRTYGAFIGGKTRTILLPMLLWNLLALMIISGGAYAEFLKADRKRTRLHSSH